MRQAYKNTTQQIVTKMGWQADRPPARPAAKQTASPHSALDIAGNVTFRKQVRDQAPGVVEKKLEVSRAEAEKTKHKT